LHRESVAFFSTLDSDREVTLTHARLDQLLEAEITTIGLRECRPMTLESILNCTRNAGELAQVLHEELPVRYAQRIKMLEALPDWDATSTIAAVRRMYITSFKELRLADPRDPLFHEQLLKIKKRHLHTNLLVGGLKAYAQNDALGEGEINEWLDRFFTLRVSTNMLISHYLEIADGGRSEMEAEDEANPYQSSINPRCHPYRIASHAADVIGKLCEQWYGVAPEIRVIDVGAKPFPFVPRYLFYILSELLKNAVRATIEHQYGGSVCLRGKIESPLEARASLKPVEVLVSSGGNVSSIRISDEGGGIPVDQLGHVWSYLYTTAEPVSLPRTRESVDAPTDLRWLETGVFNGVHSLADGNEEENMLMRSPLAGLGCGLPLSRLYAQYLGGDVTLHTLPRYGTDVFVYLNSMGNHCEEFPHSS